MQLSKGTIRYLADMFQYWATHPGIQEICDKMNINVDLSSGFGKKERFFNLMTNLNDSDKLAQLISILFLEYDARNSLNTLNTILRRDGYTITDKGNIISSIGEIVELKNKLSDIEEGLKELGLKQILKDFQNGVENYGNGKNFQDIRRALEGLVKEIVDKKLGCFTGNMKVDMGNLTAPGILQTATKKFNVEGKTMELEHAHAYGVYSLLSNYIDHPNPKTLEIEKHFVFFQAVGLIWLLVKRYQKNP